MKYTKLIIPLITLPLLSFASMASTQLRPEKGFEAQDLVNLAQQDLKVSMSAIKLELFSSPTMVQRPTKLQKPTDNNLENKNNNQEQHLGHYAE